MFWRQVLDMEMTLVTCSQCRHQASQRWSPLRLRKRLGQTCLSCWSHSVSAERPPWTVLKYGKGWMQAVKKNILRLAKPSKWPPMQNPLLTSFTSGNRLGLLIQPKNNTWINCLKGEGESGNGDASTFYRASLWDPPQNCHQTPLMTLETFVHLSLIIQNIL